MPNLRHDIIYPLGLAVLGLILLNAGLYGLLAPTQPIPVLTPASSYRLEFERGLIGMEGWNAVEQTDEGITFQWTNTSPASIIFPLQYTGAMEIEFETLQAIQDQMYTDLRLMANNQLIALERRDKHYRGIIPAEVLDARASTVTLSFYTPPPIRPADQDPNSSDIRLLGIAFDWLDLRPLTP